MSKILDFHPRSIAAQGTITRLLADYQPAPQLLQAAIIDQAILDIACSPEEEAACLDVFYQQQACQTPEARDNWLAQHHLDARQLSQLVTRPLKIEKYKQMKWGAQLKDYFLTRKSKLDQVIYRAIYTKDLGVIQELYFRLTSEEENFAHLAGQYSEGPGADNDGLIGPVDVETMHPALLEVLMTTSVARQHNPIEVGQWYVLAQLEDSIPAQFDEAMQARLLNELFHLWLEDQVKSLDSLLPKGITTVAKLANPDQDLSLISQGELDELLAYLQGPKGFDIQDRQYRMTLFRQCFVGEDAVRWLMAQYSLAEEAAILLGQRLLELKMIHHVVDAHQFKNDYKFYQFSAHKTAQQDQFRVLNTTELEALVEHMRSPSGLRIAEHKHRMKTYPKCFVGRDAVQWLMENYSLAHEAAIQVGQRLVERGIIHHVYDDHSFKDEYLFYRFYIDEKPLELSEAPPMTTESEV